MSGDVSYEGLLQQVRESQFVEVRQIAAVLLRKKINTFWSRIPSAQEGIKQGLLKALMSEETSLVRKAIDFAHRPAPARRLVVASTAQ